MPETSNVATPTAGPVVQFEPATGDNDFEVIALKPGELPPADPDPNAPAIPPEPDPTKVVLSAEEYAALKDGSNSTATLASGLAALTQRITAPGQTAVPASDELNPETFETELFTPGKAASVIKKATEKAIAESTSGLSRTLVEQSKQILKLDPKTSPYYTKYEKEIEGRIASLPPQYRNHPDVYKEAYKVVVNEHTEDIIADRVKEAVDKAVAEAMGTQAAQTSVKGPAIYQEGGSGSAASSAPALTPLGRKLYLTTQDAASMRNSGLDPSDKDAVASYLEYKSQRGRK